MKAGKFCAILAITLDGKYLTIEVSDNGERIYVNPLPKEELGLVSTILTRYGKIDLSIDELSKEALVSHRDMVNSFLELSKDNLWVYSNDTFEGGVDGKEDLNVCCEGCFSAYDEKLSVLLKEYRKEDIERYSGFPEDWSEEKEKFISEKFEGDDVLLRAKVFVDLSLYPGTIYSYALSMGMDINMRGLIKQSCSNCEYNKEASLGYRVCDCDGMICNGEEMIETDGKPIKDLENDSGNCNGYNPTYEEYVKLCVSGEVNFVD